MSSIEIPIETLIQQLHSEDWMARCDAARLLGQSRDPRAVDALLPDLNDPDWRVRRNAAQALGALKDKRAVEPLLQTLQDRTMTVRQRAIVALGRIKDTQALPALLDILLQDRRESDDAVKAIRKFGKKALPELVRAFEQTNDRKLMLLLVEMKYERALELLLKLLESQEPTECLRAIEEVGKLGDQKAIPHLSPLLNHHDLLIQSETVRALGKLRAVDTIPAMLDLLKDNELYGPRSNLYHAIAEALQAFGGITDDINSAFPGNYPAVFNMGGAPISLPEALGLVRNDPSRMLVDALTKLQTGFMNPDEPIGTVFSSVRSTLDSLAWKFGVLFQDAKDAKQERVTCLMDLLKSDSGLERAAAALSLPWYMDERVLPSLEKAAHDPDETVARAATWAWSALQKAISYRDQFRK